MNSTAAAAAAATEPMTDWLSADWLAALLLGFAIFMAHNRQQFNARHAWLRKKAAHDSCAGRTEALPAARTAQLWMVHGVWYDLSAFAARHPGGSFWIEQTVGMDITELVETHHLSIAELEPTLSKLRVGAARPDYKGFYTYKDGGLYRTLKRRVHVALKAAGSASGGTTALFKAQCWAVLLLHALCFVATCYSGSYLWAAATGATIASLHGIGHNFLHQRDSLWSYACIVGGAGGGADGAARDARADPLLVPPCPQAGTCT